MNNGNKCERERTELTATTKLTTEHDREAARKKTPSIANVLLMAVILICNIIKFSNPKKFSCNSIKVINSI